ncbi:MAG: chemotaxis protein CheW [Burkholderiales bacterium]|nr:chemotaxis protein CheW [Burkholderiales bacterium]
MTIDMSQFFQVFFDEADELLAEKEKLLLAVDISSPDPEDLNAIFRAAHSIKGGASTFGLTDMTEVTHILESLLDKIRKGEMALTAEHVDAFLIAKDVLKMQLDGHRLGTPVDQEAVADVRMLLQSLSQDATPVAAPVINFSNLNNAADTPQENYRMAFKIEMPEISAEDASALMSELGLLGAITRAETGNDSVILHLKTNEGQDDIISICSFILNPDCLKITEENFVSNEAGSVSKESEEELGYGFFEPLDSMFPPENTVTAASEARSVVSADAASPKTLMPVEKKSGVKKEPEKNNVTQESSTIRVGIEKVDQLINLIGELVITQAMLEQRTQDLDPIVHERLLGSVAHLTRNTRDLQEAVMSIRMMPMDYVFSRFPRMVRDLATKLGKKVEFVTYGASTELDKGLIERIVDPLTHLVRNSIDHGIEMPATRLGAGKSETGRLSLSSIHQGGNIVIEVSDDGGGLHREKILDKARQNYGTTITISLPLTLAILDGMSIKIGNEIYILPLGFVVESLQPAKQDVKDVNGKGRVVKVRDEYLPLVPLYQYFDIEPKFTAPSDGIVVIVEVDGKKAALFVDDLVGQQQVVVKNIESNYKKVTGISGATILGDGGVALILDVAALLRSTR